jgi:hypothetical protein
MSLDDYSIITEKEKYDVRKTFLDLIHSGKRYQAIEYYQKLNDVGKKCIQEDKSGNWELMNSFRYLEA